MMKGMKTLWTAAALLLSLPMGAQMQRISILGDSYSTFQNYTSGATPPSRV